MRSVPTLPLHSAHFTLQLLDLAHRLSEREDNGIHIFDVLLLGAAVYISIKMDPARAQVPRPTRPLADLLATIARLLARRQTHNAPLLHTRWTFSKLLLRSIASWKSSTASVQLLRQQHGSTSSNSGSFGGNSNSISRVTRTFTATSQLARSRRACYCSGVLSGPSLYRELQTQSIWGNGLVPLWSILEMSRTDRSPLEVTQRRFATLLVSRHSTSPSVSCMLLLARRRSVLDTLSVFGCSNSPARARFTSHVCTSVKTKLSHVVSGKSVSSHFIFLHVFHYC